MSALARQTDLFTSHQAAQLVKTSPNRRRRRAALEGLLQRYPERTYQELFELHKTECERRSTDLIFADAPSLMKRLNDWGMCTGANRQCRVTGKSAKTWVLRK